MNRKSKIFETAGIGLIAVAVWTVLIMLSDASPSEAYAMFFKGIFGNLNGFMEVFVKATPLIFTGLGCAVAFRTGFFNIGAEGQFYIGGPCLGVGGPYLDRDSRRAPHPVRHFDGICIWWSLGSDSRHV